MVNYISVFVPSHDMMMCIEYQDMYRYLDGLLTCKQCTAYILFLIPQVNVTVIHRVIIIIPWYFPLNRYKNSAIWNFHIK